MPYRRKRKLKEMNYKNITHSEIVSKIKESRYFSIKELVSKAVYDRDGERAWRYFDTRLLITMFFIREKKGKAFTVNNWSYGGAFEQRGLRENISDIVRKKTVADKLYLSAHTMGKGIDFDVKGESASEVRRWLLEIQDELPFKIRLERKILSTGKEISWVHLDVFDEDKNDKVYLFDI
jgi:hypothetical protein